MSAEALERLETKIAYLERANNELSDVVYRQHREIEALRARLESLAVRVSTLRSQEEARTSEDERPPHY
ncbi:MAG: SlyX family protein [Steroidobacteraceae bacterium]